MFEQSITTNLWFAKESNSEHKADGTKYMQMQICPSIPADGNNLHLHMRQVGVVFNSATNTEHAVKWSEIKMWFFHFSNLDWVKTELCYWMHIMHNCRFLKATEWCISVACYFHITEWQVCIKSTGRSLKGIRWNKLCEQIKEPNHKDISSS